jgi:hypothetical protein
MLLTDVHIFINAIFFVTRVNKKSWYTVNSASDNTHWTLYRSYFKGVSAKFKLQVYKRGVLVTVHISMYTQQHVRLYKTVKYRKFKPNLFTIKYRFIRQYLKIKASLSWCYLDFTPINMPEGVSILELIRYPETIKNVTEPYITTTLQSLSAIKILLSKVDGRCGVVVGMHKNSKYCFWNKHYYNCNSSNEINSVNVLKLIFDFYYDTSTADVA